MESQLNERFFFFPLQEEARQQVIRKISENLTVEEEIRRQKLLAYG